MHIPPLVYPPHLCGPEKARSGLGLGGSAAGGPETPPLMGVGAAVRDGVAAPALATGMTLNGAPTHTGRPGGASA